jgi:hypothetical protein
MTGLGTQHVAPVQPFRDAINDWVAREVRRRHGEDPYLRWHRTGGKPGTPLEVTVARYFAEAAGLNRDYFNRLMDGTYTYIDLRRADKLALTLDIPLPLLADEFKSVAEWEAERTVAV